MMASLRRKRGKLRWRGRVMVHGREREKWFPDQTKTSERAAVAWEEKTQKKMVKEEKEEKIATDQNQNTAYGFIDWMDEYLDDVKSRYSSETYKEKKSAFNRFIEFHKTPLNFPVSGLIIDMCRDFLTAQNNERSGNAANKDRKNFMCAWTWGMENLSEWDAGTVNPFQKVKKFKEVRHPRYVPPVEDFWKIYDVVTDQQDKTMLLTFLHLAARRGEIFRMKRNDLDFQNNRARLWTRKRDGGIEYDWLPMTTELSEALAEWWKERMKMDLRDKEHVFVCLHESRATEQYYGMPFKERRYFIPRACEKAGVEPYFTYHAIRHLTATILYHKGYPASHIQLVLRHKNLRTTELYLQRLGLEIVRDTLEESLCRGEKVISFKEAKKRRLQKK